VEIHLLREVKALRNLLAGFNVLAQAEVDLGLLHEGSCLQNVELVLREYLGLVSQVLLELVQVLLVELALELIYRFGYIEHELSLNDPGLGLLDGRYFIELASLFKHLNGLFIVLLHISTYIHSEAHVRLDGLLVLLPSTRGGFKARLALSIGRISN